MSTDIDRKRELQLIDQVDALNEEVKVLALNLAIFLAKAKKDSKQLLQLEPAFIRLVNGTVKVVQDLALIINAARNKKPSVDDVPADQPEYDLIEVKLRSILELCNRIMSTLSRAGNLSG